jgi:hypothetical protein
MKVKVCTPVQKSYRVEARVRKGRKRWVKVPLASARKQTTRCMASTPPDSPMIQPMQAPPLWDDHADNPYDVQQETFQPLPLPRSMESTFDMHA